MKTPEQIVHERLSLLDFGHTNDEGDHIDPADVMIDPEDLPILIGDAIKDGWFDASDIIRWCIAAIEADRGQFPDGNLRPRFEPGERVEEVIWRGPYGPKEYRPGVVVAIDEEPRMHHYLRVRFDDGEERQINPDVMRRVRA